MNRTTHLIMVTSRQPLLRSRALVIVGVSIIVGFALLIAVLASGVFSAGEVADGSVTSGAEIINATGASNGKAVEFGVSPATPKPVDTPIAPTPSPTPNTSPYQNSTKVVKAFDTDDALGQSWFDSMAADGFQLYILDTVSLASECADNACTRPVTSCQLWTSATQQIQYALNAGMSVGVYNRNPQCWQNGIAGLGAFTADIKFYAIDVQADPGVAPTAAMVNGIRALGVTPIIFTGSTAWSAIMGSSTAFSNLPLQDVVNASNTVYADWVPSLLTPSPVAYGGWNLRSTSTGTGYSNLRVGAQQASNTEMFGQDIDLDSFNVTWLNGL